jgi:hypothetical protein
MGKTRNSGKISVGREGTTWKTQTCMGDDIKTRRMAIGWYVVIWSHIVPDSDQWRALVNAVMKLQVPKKGGNVLNSFSRRGLCTCTSFKVHVV